MKHKKKELSFFGKLLLWINIAFAVALLLSYLAPFTDPRTFWPIAFFGLGYPPLLLVNAIFVAIWAFRKSYWVLISVLCIVVGFKVLTNNIGFSLPSNVGDNVKVIRVMTYNAHDFKRYGAKNDISTKHEILELIGTEQPDVIGIQEFYTRKKGEYDMVDSIKRVMNAKYYYFEPIMVAENESIGMAIFSKFPIKNHGLVQLSFKGSTNQCLYVDVEQKDTKFRLYSVHLQSINFDPQDYKYLGALSKKGKTNIGATRRLGGKLKSAFMKRSEQVFTIKDHAKTSPYPYVISGDFNDTPSSFAVNQMCKGLKNSFRERGSGLGRTYNGDFPNYQIDYVMVSPEFDVADYQIIEKKLSDHYPLRTDLVLKSAQAN
jgi:endonuclease/exonuclease/phosphatase family metal-dependent hydrolase